MSEYREVKLRVELDVTGNERPEGDAASRDSAPAPRAATPFTPPQIPIPAHAAPGRAGSPGSVGMPGAPGPAGSPSSIGTGWAPIPGPISAPPAPAGPSGSAVPPPIPGSSVAPPSLATERQIIATVNSQIAATISGASPGRSAVQSLIQAGAGASGVGGVLPTAGVAAAGVLATVAAVERFGPSLAIAASKDPILQAIADADPTGLLRKATPSIRDFEEFSRGAAHLRSNLSAALNIGQNLEETVTDQAVLFGRADVPLAAREAHAQYRIDTELKALEKYRAIYEREAFAGATTSAENLMISLFSGISQVVGR